MANLWRGAQWASHSIPNWGAQGSIHASTGIRAWARGLGSRRAIHWPNGRHLLKLKWGFENFLCSIVLHTFVANLCTSENSDIQKYFRLHICLYETNKKAIWLFYYLLQSNHRNKCAWDNIEWKFYKIYSVCPLFLRIPTKGKEPEKRWLIFSY